MSNKNLRMTTEAYLAAAALMLVHCCDCLHSLEADTNFGLVNQCWARASSSKLRLKDVWAMGNVADEMWSDLSNMTLSDRGISQTEASMSSFH